MISPETRMMGLPYGEEIMIVGRTMWTQSTSVTDRRTELRSQRPCNAERRTVQTKIFLALEIHDGFTEQSLNPSACDQLHHFSIFHY